MTDDVDLLAAAGELLHGPRWQATLAETLEVSERNMRYWASGRHKVPPGIWPELARLLRRHARETEKVAARLDTRAAAEPPR